MDNDKELLWETVYKVARLSASRCVRIHRHLVTADDVFQHLSLWAVEHWHKIEEWEGQDSLVFKLKRTFNNESQKFASKERAYKSKSSPSDSFYYTHEILQELLKDVWHYEQWVQSATPSDAEFISKSSKPSEGMNREVCETNKSGYKLYSDVDFEQVAPKCSWITPVPGGVGLLTIIGLLKNTLAAANKSIYA